MKFKTLEKLLEKHVAYWTGCRSWPSDPWNEFYKPFWKILVACFRVYYNYITGYGECMCKCNWVDNLEERKSRLRPCVNMDSMLCACAQSTPDLLGVSLAFSDLSSSLF